MQQKAWSRIRVKQEKEAEFIHSQSKKRRRTNQNGVASKEGKLNFLHDQLFSPLLNIFPITPPPLLTSSPPTP